MQHIIFQTLWCMWALGTVMLIGIMRLACSKNQGLKAVDVVAPCLFAAAPRLPDSSDDSKALSNQTIQMTAVMRKHHKEGIHSDIIISFTKEAQNELRQ